MGNPDCAALDIWWQSFSIFLLFLAHIFFYVGAMLSTSKLKRSLCILLIPLFIVSALFILQREIFPSAKFRTFGLNPLTPLIKPKPIHRPPPADLPPPIVDNFPLAASAKTPSELPPIPPWNSPPNPHVDESTPLFIGFTRNWRLLQQTVVSYITAGWPPSDIYVVENTGVMHSNRQNLLTLQNPFYIDYHRLNNILGINVISTPTLFTFAQLQNFYTYTALEKGWSHYWWAHMDDVVVSDEEWNGEPYKSLYLRAVDALRQTMDPAWGPLATLWFAYDHLALVRTQAFVDVGGWDTMIPFYMTDCDMHERLWMKGFRIEAADAGRVWDVATSLDDLEMLYRRGLGRAKSSGKREDISEAPGEPAEVQRNSPAYRELIESLDVMQHVKGSNKGGRNTWQSRQRGGQGEPFYRDSEGFERGILMWMDFGRKVFEEKWGRGKCDLRDSGLEEGDAWKVLLDWEKPEVQMWYQSDRAREEEERIKKEKADEKERVKETEGQAKEKVPA